MQSIPFAQAARLPIDTDNVAIATRHLEAGTVIEHASGDITLGHTVMEGHRFVLEPIADGEFLLSWGMPFGRATRALAPGEYVCNEKILEALAEREVDFALPGAPNFADYQHRFEVDERTFVPGEQVLRVDEAGRFEGFRRSSARGVGTRNFIVVLGTTARSAGFASVLAERFEDAEKGSTSFDGVVAVTHTEGGGNTPLNNLDKVMRTLSGFIVHPNAGAVLIADYPGADSELGNAALARFMRENGYALDDVPHAFFDISDDFDTELGRAEAIIQDWLPAVTATPRTPESLANLKVALQCGGSDAFSGVSGNALAGWVAKELIRNGGSANLAETDELIGAEPYVLANVRDIDTARSFLDKIEVFRERAGFHGASAEGNPSGGNNFRGLYNIALKSIGAARKKDPDVRLDYVIDYGEPMREPGYYFMDSPGNDLESIAGQVAAGSNIIFFITGNGSITNFPFVPTLKFVTTSGRFEMLANEMDVNAGRYNDGMPMDELGRETFELAREVASGKRSKGEMAGHAQVQLWRNWAQTGKNNLGPADHRPPPAARALRARPGQASELSFEAYRTAHGHASDQIGLIMPTSLCSGQVAKLIADSLNRTLDEEGGAGRAVNRYVALVHTEGCESVNAEDLYLETLVGHLKHPFTRGALMLEHGCEKTHNDAVRHYMEARGLAAEDFGWASVQLDGGIQSVKELVSEWFEHRLGDRRLGERETVPAGELRLGLVTDGPVGEAARAVLGQLTRGLVAAGGTVVIAENSSALEDPTFRAEILAPGESLRTTLAYGQYADAPGLHVMAAPTGDASETLTGMGGTGVELVLGYAGRAPMQSHPMVPMLQASAEPAVVERYAKDMDLVLDDDPARALAALEQAIADVASGRRAPKLHARRNVQFQLTRGNLGISL